jgi:hypothetical protein
MKNYLMLTLIVTNIKWTFYPKYNQKIPKIPNRYVVNIVTIKRVVKRILKNISLPRNINTTNTTKL